MMNRDSLIIKPKAPKGEDGYKVFSVRIKDKIVAQLEEISAQSGHSRNELIGILLEFALDRCTIDKEPISEYRQQSSYEGEYT